MRDKRGDRVVALWSLQDLFSGYYLLEVRQGKGRHELHFGPMQSNATPRLYHSEHAANCAILGLRRAKPETLDKRRVTTKQVYLSVPL